jgi:hypothetical protein
LHKSPENPQKSEGNDGTCSQFDVARLEKALSIAKVKNRDIYILYEVIGLGVKLIEECTGSKEAIVTEVVAVERISPHASFFILCTASPEDDWPRYMCRSIP